MYGFDMHSVQRIPLILLLLCCATACSSSSDVEYFPPIAPDAPTVQEPEGVDPARPSGYIADPKNRYFHRLDCPYAKEVKPSIRQFYLTPYDALNEGYAPCDYCDPMSGWN